MRDLGKKWHSLPMSEVLSETKSSRNGLTSFDAEKRLKDLGRNILPQGRKQSKLVLFLRQFNSPLMYIILAAAGVSFFTRKYSDSVFIVVVILINTIVGFYQENKASKSLDLLKRMVKIRAKVLRDGNKKEIDSEELVMGDVVFLKPGDRVPADARIIESRGLKVNEASLTGEFDPAEKKAGSSLPEGTLISEQVNMVFTGTVVQEGEAVVVVIATGSKTQIGKIVKLLKETKQRKTPLQKKISALSRWLGFFILFVVAIILIEGYVNEKNFAEVFEASLALAVSAIPEGILPAVTVILVFSMRRIFGQKGLVRKLVATETLGSVTVICTDKTGTITEGEMQVGHILTSTRELMGSDIGGLAGGKNYNGVESHILALKIATLANEGFIENPEAELQKWVVRGRPTERALLLAGIEAGLNKKELEKQYPVIDRINFDSSYKFAASLCRTGEKKNSLYMIGAPEEVIFRSVNLDADGKNEKLDGLEYNKLIQKFKALAAKGLRVLACAYKDVSCDAEYKDLFELSGDGFTLVGFIALKDPLRKDTKESIKITQKAGIRTVIITGDHKLTAQTIAEEIGIDAKDENIIDGSELELIDDQELKERAKHISIYARVLPEHKLRIVEALQDNGEVVAMIGDGINDAPALKAADIGVAVGSGTDVAKEVSEMVLLDDNFKTVVKAVEQGRAAFENIRKVSVYLLADDFQELFLFFVAMAMGLPLPLLPAQILWINLVEDGFPDIALTTEQELDGIMNDKPRSPKEPILNRPIKFWLTAVLFIAGLSATLLFFVFWKLTGDLPRTRTIIFALSSVDSLILAFSIRSFKKIIFRKDIFSNRYLVYAAGISFALLLLGIYLPPLQKLLSAVPLGIFDWAVVFCVSLIEITLIEFFKNKILISKSVAKVRV